MGEQDVPVETVDPGSTPGPTSRTAGPEPAPVDDPPGADTRDGGERPDRALATAPPARGRVTVATATAPPQDDDDRPTGSRTGTMYRANVTGPDRPNAPPLDRRQPGTPAAPSSWSGLTRPDRSSTPVNSPPALVPGQRGGPPIEVDPARASAAVPGLRRVSLDELGTAVARASGTNVYGSAPANPEPPEPVRPPEPPEPPEPPPPPVPEPEPAPTPTPPAPGPPVPGPPVPGPPAPGPEPVPPAPGPTPPGPTPPGPYPPGPVPPMPSPPVPPPAPPIPAPPPPPGPMPAPPFPPPPVSAPPVVPAPTLPAWQSPTNPGGYRGSQTVGAIPAGWSSTATGGPDRAGTVYGGGGTEGPGFATVSFPAGNPVENTGSLTGHILAQGWTDTPTPKSSTARVVIVLAASLGLLVAISLLIVLMANNAMDGLPGILMDG